MHLNNYVSPDFGQPQMQPWLKNVTPAHYGFDNILLATNPLKGMVNSFLRLLVLFVMHHSFAESIAANKPEADLPTNIDWEHPVYRSGFDSDDALQDWLLEGGKDMRVEEGSLVLESEGEYTRPVGGQGNHLVAWLKPEMPANFYLEFDFRPEKKQQGLAIIFFNARGLHGESVFDASLKKRKGNFKQYHSGDLNNYHISYWSGARAGSNLRKNKGFQLVASGEDPISADTTDSFNRVGLYKDGGVIRYYVDGKLALEFVDDGKAYGQIWDNPGWIALRQMDHAHLCQYDNLTVYPLRNESPDPQAPEVSK